MNDQLLAHLEVAFEVFCRHLLAALVARAHPCPVLCAVCHVEVAMAHQLHFEAGLETHRFDLAANTPRILVSFDCVLATGTQFHETAFDSVQR